MSISYSGIVGHGKITLPSVESWGSNMNILRDPPKGIFTRRKDKVGQTSLITENIDVAGDRVCEAIQVYARGKNPMVEVEYGQNSSGNAGLSGSLVPSLTASGNSRPQASLPYKIGEVFRPPVLRQENLLPLSRMPRIWTSAFTSKDFPNFSLKMRSCNPDSRAIKENPLKTCVRPTAVFQVEKPFTEPFEVKYVIQNPIKVSGNSGLRTIDLTTTDSDTKRNIKDEIVQYNIDTNKSDNKYINNNTLNTDTFIKDSDMYKQVETNPSSNQFYTPIENLINTHEYIKDEVHHTNYTTPINGNTTDLRVHDDIVLGRNLPEWDMTSNKSNNIHKNVVDSYIKQLDRNHPLAQGYSNPGTLNKGTFNDNNSREYSLSQKINAGSFDPKPTMRHNERVNMYEHNTESQRTTLGRKAMSQFHERFMNNPYELRA